MMLFVAKEGHLPVSRPSRLHHTLQHEQNTSHTCDRPAFMHTEDEKQNENTHEDSNHIHCLILLDEISSIYLCTVYSAQSYRAGHTESEVVDDSQQKKKLKTKKSSRVTVVQKVKQVCMREFVLSSTDEQSHMTNCKSSNVIS